MRVEILKGCKLFGEDVTKSVRNPQTGKMFESTAPSEIPCKVGECRVVPDEVGAAWIKAGFARELVRPDDEDINESVELEPIVTQPARPKFPEAEGEAFIIGAADVGTISAEELAG